jgi:acetyltransferase
MIDVDFGDLIDYFGSDPKTKSILMYIEGITQARKFMSAARHFARTKPIVVVKAGRFSESAKAVASHTGALTGSDMTYDAALRRAGIVRVDTISDLFNCAEVLGVQPLPRGPRLAVITNAGGPGVMTADALIADGGKLAELNQKTIDELNKVLPPFWSRGNPIDVLGDAQSDRYEAVLNACIKDDNIDGILIIYTPQGVADPVEIAKNIAKISSKKGVDKPILTSFMGEEEVAEANKMLNLNNIPTYSTPEQGVKTYMYMYQYSRNLDILYQTPEELPVDSAPPKRPINVIIKEAAKQNREILTETEAKRLLENYNIPIVKTIIAATEDEAVAAASQIGYPVVLKILSPQIVHKSDIEGVMLDINNRQEVIEAFQKIMKNAKERVPGAEIQGVTVQPMIRQTGYEIILGAQTDPVFGPVVLFGMGGVGVEIFKDVTIGLPPLNQNLAKRMMEETKVYKLLKGFRNMPPANLKLIEETIVRFAQMLIDFPAIKEVDINPMFVNEKEAFALDARIVIDKERVFKKTAPYDHLVISPYPKRYESVWTMRDGRTVLLRPIKPEMNPFGLRCSRVSPRSLCVTGSLTSSKTPPTRYVSDTATSTTTAKSVLWLSCRTENARFWVLCG